MTSAIAAPPAVMRTRTSPRLPSTWHGARRWPPTFAAGHPVALRAEIELAVRLSTDVRADDDEETISGAIAGIGVALELVDVGRPSSRLDAIVAANVFHRAFVLGPCDTRPGLRDRTATLSVSGRRHCADEPYPHVVDFLTGSVVHVAVAPGDEVVAEIEALGRVRAEVGP